ncbi:DUF6970 domain-containing protein [Pontibacter harenae]|uniref:DUF6970 domain-containing protein n=1 Tax=Pontibacter harenae TaxID=2894083 RepID=UPI001E468624|nr:hypothetical protein [Pontibacter harenae]MCC9165387.1 hypothetical protein [Pontibacter harenae]
MGTKESYFKSILLLLICLMSACKPGISLQITDREVVNAQSAPWLNELIQQLQQEKPVDPPAKIYRYTYNDQEVFYLTGRCCDLPGKVYDMYGNVLCEPDGGITGRGDGRCTDFFEKRTNEKLIWKDNRQP